MPNIQSYQSDFISMDNEILALQNEQNALSASVARRDAAQNDPRMVSKNANDQKIRALQYPISGGNSHFVRFFVHVNEESRLIKNKIVETDGPVDNSNQNRANKGTATNESISTTMAIGGAALGGKVGAEWSSYKIKKLFGTGIPTSAGYKAGAAGLSALGTGAAAAIGAVAGYAAGPIVAETFHLTNRLQRLKSSITLYSPSDIRVDYSMNYEITEDTLSALAQADQSKDIVRAISHPGDAMKGISSIARILAAKTKTISILSRTAVNPKKDIMFSGVNNRTFQFNYTFAPRSAEEATAVADIIYMFKFFAHPEMLPGYGDFLYLYPAEFEIHYGITQPDGTEIPDNENLNAISSCVLESISINYAPNGSFQSLKNGEPIITELSLSFKEIELLHQGRIQQGF